MEDFGDWLYLIIIIIAGVSSVISSARKKARQTAEQKQSRKEVTNSSPEEDFWNEEASPQQLPQKEPVITIKPKQQSSPSYQSIATQKKHYFDIQQEGRPSLTQEDTEFMSAETDQEGVSITLEELPSNIDEWRKAFVYNEIFNRKY